MGRAWGLTSSDKIWSAVLLSASGHPHGKEALVPKSALVTLPERSPLGDKLKPVGKASEPGLSDHVKGPLQPELKNWTL